MSDRKPGGHELLKAQPGMTLEQLIAATGRADRTVRGALKKLGTNDKRAGSQGEKLWSLDEDEAT